MIPFQEVLSYQFSNSLIFKILSYGYLLLTAIFDIYSTIIGEQVIQNLGYYHFQEDGIKYDLFGYRIKSRPWA